MNSQIIINSSLLPLYRVSEVSGITPVLQLDLALGGALLALAYLLMG